jgi:S1-C subfamily serine protease
VRHPLLAFLLTCSCLAETRTIYLDPAPGETALIERDKDATVAVVQQDDDGARHIVCAGVWVSPTRILTAAHCTDVEVEFLYYGETGDDGDRDRSIGWAHATHLVRRDELIDLAIVEAEAPPDLHPSALVSGIALAPGLRVEVIGHTGGLPFSWAPGWLSSVRHMKGPDPIEGEFLQVWTGAWGGNSGGGVWDADGRLLGICSFRTNGAPLTFFVSRDTLLGFLGAP